MRHNTRGFTLIELLVVISIIGLLSSVVIASLNSARIDARNTARNSIAIQLRNAFNLAYNGSYPNVAVYYPCLTTVCSGGWSPHVGNATVDAYLSPYMKKPTDPVGGARGYGGYILFTPSNWVGLPPTWPAAYYIDYLLEPGGECPTGSYYDATANYVQCIFRVDIL